jgi:hypothetical protein
MDPETTLTTSTAQPEWCDPFCEPQTIPSGWDVSAILHAAGSTTEIGAED